MNDFEFSDIGKQIAESFDNIMHSKDMMDIKENVRSTIDATLHTVRDSVNDAVSNVNQSLTNSVDATTQKIQRSANENRERYRERARQGDMNARKTYERPAYVKREPLSLYQSNLPINRNPSGNVGGILMIVFGTLGAVTFGTLDLVFFFMSLFTDSVAIPVVFVLLLFCLICIDIACDGGKKLGRIRRFRKYVRILGNNEYIQLDELSHMTGKKQQFLYKDLKWMTKKHWFLEGKFDQQKTCFMATNSAYNMYMNSILSYDNKGKKEVEATPEEEVKEVSALTKVLEEGTQMIAQIREVNDQIESVDISEKLDKLEVVAKEIFGCIKKRPEEVADTHKFLNYYLPMTLKLVIAYRDFDKQKIQGENIKKAKKEIETTLDKINVAFENMLDNMYQNDLLDVSSDISVLNTMLAQEGLMGSDFSKEDK